MRRRSLPWLSKAVALIASLGALLSLTITALHWGVIAAEPSSTILAAMTVCAAGLWTVASTATGHFAVWHAMPLVVAPLMSNICLAVSAPVHSPWMVPWSTLAAMVAPLLWRRRVSLGLVLVNAAAYGAARAGSEPWTLAAIAAAIPLCGAVVVTRIVGAISAQFASVVGATVAADADAIRAEEQIALQHARAWWNRMMHDKVIGALMLGARATSPRELELARVMADEALAAFRETSPRGESHGAPNDQSGLSSKLAALARSHGLIPEVGAVGEVDPPEEVVAALVSASDQALSNVSRHAGVNRVDMQIEHSSSRAVVVIRDRGRGFDPTRIDERRLGLRMSMPSHLDDLHGTTDVWSRPGRGTRIELAWAAPEMSSSPKMLGDGGRRWSWCFTATWIVLHLLGAAASGGLPARLSSGVIVVSLQVALSAAHLSDRRGPSSWFPAISIAGSIVFACSLTLGGPGSGQPWLIGALTPVFVILAVQGFSTLAVGAGAVVCTILIGGATVGGGLDRPVQWALPLVALPSFVWLLSNQFDRAHQELQAARQRADSARQRAARSDAIQALLDRRSSRIDPHTLPLLEKLASGDLFLAADRDLAVLAEAANRDLLVARPLISTDVATAARDARARRVIVHLSSSAPIVIRTPEATTHALMGAVQAELIDALRHASPGDRVTARWHPGGILASATLAVTRACADELGLDDIFVEFGPLSLVDPRKGDTSELSQLATRDKTRSGELNSPSESPSSRDRSISAKTCTPDRCCR